MAKIDFYVPEPKPEYNIDVQRQIIQAIDTLKSQLNTSFLEEQVQETQRFTWFNLRFGC
jgi:CRISPR/Cas system endoribonuclease Cas6 (RAMP superfamily)